MDHSHIEYLEANKQRFLDELFEWLKIPTISADPVYKDHMLQGAIWVRDHLEGIGMDNVQLLATEGFPVVYADKILDQALPTILVYGHYDVQPVVPLELWHTPPFEPVIVDECITARGASDDKGQVFMQIKALEAMLAQGNLPCNVKILIEGEEEVGSDHLPKLLSAQKELFSCDVILVSDTSMIANDVPSLDTGLRGLSYVEVELTGPSHDLHSGVFGGAVANPIHVLSQMISSLHTSEGKVNIPHFYDQVEELSTKERELLAAAPFDLSKFKESLEIIDVWGEQGYTTPERTGIRPTLDVNGIWGGYTGEGSKTVLPSKAFAKISMRLVPNQEHEHITRLFQQHFASIAPSQVSVKVTPHHGGNPYVLPLDSIAYKAAEEAMNCSFGKPPVPTRGGGSIPIVSTFEKILGVKTVLMGFGLDSDLIHSPNEHFGVFNFYKGIQTIPYFYQSFTKLWSQTL